MIFSGCSYSTNFTGGSLPRLFGSAGIWARGPMILSKACDFGPIDLSCSRQEARNFFSCSILCSTGIPQAWDAPLEMTTFSPRSTLFHWCLSNRWHRDVVHKEIYCLLQHTISGGLFLHRTFESLWHWLCHWVFNNYCRYQIFIDGNCRTQFRWHFPGTFCVRRAETASKSPWKDTWGQSGC